MASFLFIVNSQQLWRVGKEKKGKGNAEIHKKQINVKPQNPGCEKLIRKDHKLLPEKKIGQ